tara:strand:+ start:4452 stop:4712 length:261 start_codon:yes stop_codon:yes gene_type:complete
MNLTMQTFSIAPLHSLFAYDFQPLKPRTRTLHDLLEFIWMRDTEVIDPHIIYGPITVDGILVAPRRCPYCSSQGIFLQVDNHVQYI